jgi:hypothetical protein
VVITAADEKEYKLTDQERKKLIKDFRDGKIKTLIGVNIFILGFDTPAIENVLMLRPTASQNFFIQSMARGLRPSPNKKYTTVYDFVYNCARFGSVKENINWEDRFEGIDARMPGEGGDEIKKKCPCCGKRLYPAVRVCPYCNLNFFTNYQVKEKYKNHIKHIHSAAAITTNAQVIERGCFYMKKVTDVIETKDVPSSFDLKLYDTKIDLKKVLKAYKDRLANSEQKYREERFNICNKATCYNVERVVKNLALCDLQHEKIPVMTDSGESNLARITEEYLAYLGRAVGVVKPNIWTIKRLIEHKYGLYGAGQCLIEVFLTDKKAKI